MNLVEKYRTTKIISILMSAAFVIALIFGIMQHKEKTITQALLENNYHQALYGLSGNMEQLTLLTGKSRIVGVGQANNMLPKIQAEAAQAMANLSALPIDHVELKRMSQYFNQISDYADSLHKKLNTSGSISEEDYQRIAKIYEELQPIYQQIKDLEEALSGGVGFQRLGMDQRPLDIGTNGVVPAAAGTNSKDYIFSSADYFNVANKLISDIEPMEYEGAYSTHMLNLTAKGLQNQAEVSAAEAREIAEKFIKDVGWENITLSRGNEINKNGTVPIYTFTFGGKNGADSIDIGVSKAGGKIIFADNQRVVDVAKVKFEEAKEGIMAFVEKAGYTGMEIVSQQTNDNILFLKLARRDDREIIYYPDSIIVKVALDTGKIIGLDAHEYWNNFSERTISENIFDVDQIASGFNKSFVENSRGLAMISDGIGGEKLCHEFKGNCGEEEYWLYNNIDDGMDEQILFNKITDIGFMTY